MHYLTVLASITFIALILIDGFEAMVLPRRIGRRWRLARLFYINTWRPWAWAAARMKPGKRRNTFLSVFGPVSLLLLLMFWAAGLILSFAAMLWALEVPLSGHPGTTDFQTTLYMSGVTFFTLGYGDVTPMSNLGRFVVVAEAGIGFGFLAVIIGFLPVVYSAFSRREAPIILLDARAGSPPTALQLLARYAERKNLKAMEGFLADWERWSAEFLESHMSFPMLCYYRSMHDNQSWLAALTLVLDTCSLLLATVTEKNMYQTQATFAMARHAVVDVALVFLQKLPPGEEDRLPAEKFREIYDSLSLTGMLLREPEGAREKLQELRAMYEPFVIGLARVFLFPLPGFMPERATVDNWQTSAWMRRAPGFNQLGVDVGDDHFD